MGNLGKSTHLRGSAVTNVGQVRSHNEDNVHLWSGDNLLVAIVADGMGGAAAGEEASRIAVETISDKLGIGDMGVTDANVDFPVDLLSSAVQEANLMIMQEAVDHPSNKGMGTTVTMAFVKDNVARFAHVGDSRAYRVSTDGTIEQITSDHSFVQALVEAEHITPEQAETHPMRNVLYRALGQTKDLDVDTYSAELSTGDRLVLCSDGLTGHVRADEIAEVASSFDSPNAISQKLVELANSRGGEDNISVIVIIVDSAGVEKRAHTYKDVDDEDGDTAILDPQNLPPEAFSADDSTLPMDRRTGRDYAQSILPTQREGRSRRTWRVDAAPLQEQLRDMGEGQDATYPRR